MVDEFIRKHLYKETGVNTPQDKVYEKYIEFCKENNEVPESRIWFGRKMNIFGYPSKQVFGKGNIYFDIGMKE